jgi:hypothetical protein
MRIFTDKGFERYLAEEKEKRELYRYYDERIREICNVIDRLDHRVYVLEHGAEHGAEGGETIAE